MNGPKSFPLSLRFVAVSAMGFAAGVMEPVHVVGAENESSVAEIVRLLESIPEWPILPLVDSSPDFEQKRLAAENTAKEIKSIVAKIAEHDTDLIRAAFVEFSIKKDAPRRDALEIVNRYLFKVPERPTSLEDNGMARYRSAGPMLPRDVPLTNSFPWVSDELGDLHFSIEGRGFIGFGRPYNGVRAFDYYREHFGRRSDP